MAKQTVLVVLALSFCAQVSAGDLGDYTLRLAAHGAFQYVTDGVSTQQAMARSINSIGDPRGWSVNYEGNRPLGMWGSVAADSIACGSADFLAGKIRKKWLRFSTETLVRGGCVYLGLSRKAHNDRVGR